jgi:hypothetical protein
MASMAQKCQLAMRTWRRRFLAFELSAHLVADEWNGRRRNIIGMNILFSADAACRITGTITAAAPLLLMGFHFLINP